MKRYKLLKDLPGYDPGCQFRLNGEVPEWDQGTNGKQWAEACAYIGPILAFGAHPDFFEPIEEPQYTRSDIVDFIMWHDCTPADGWAVAINIFFDWIEHKKQEEQ